MSSTYEIQLHESNEELQDHQKSIFNALWDKIAKAEKSLDRAKIKQNKIISEFNEIALPAEESFNTGYSGTTRLQIDVVVNGGFWYFSELDPSAAVYRILTQQLDTLKNSFREVVMV